MILAQFTSFLPLDCPSSSTVVFTYYFFNTLEQILFCTVSCDLEVHCNNDVSSEHRCNGAHQTSNSETTASGGLGIGK